MQTITKFIAGLIAWRIYRHNVSPSIGKISESTPVFGGRLDRENGVLIVEKNQYSKFLIGRKPTQAQLERAWQTEAIVKRYGLQGIEFGNWMDNVDRYSHNVAIDAALDDLAKIMGVKNLKRIGGNGQLTISVGARGQGGFVMGHFESHSNAINLTKTRGAFSVLGHEYGHYLDYRKGKNSGGDSVRKTPEYKSTWNKNGLPYLYEKLFDVLYYTPKGEKTPYHEFQLNQTKYYQQRNEVFARTFQFFLYTKMKALGIRNEYLQGAITDDMPDGKEAKASIPWMQKIVKKSI